MEARVKSCLAIVGAALLMFISLSYADELKKNTTATGTGIGQIPEHREVTRLGMNSALSEYMPLDKGSVWTYGIESDGASKEHTQRIVSESGGWSIFDSYFGKESLALRIAPAGDIYVNMNGQVNTFYNAEVTASFPEDVFETPAGRFTEVMVVTMPEGGGFWFRDVYAKGVGLVFHEHKSPKGAAAYTLLKATVRGKDYPGK